MRMHLAPNQWQVLICIVRKTYGFHKKVDYIANSQIVEATGLCKAVVSRVLHNLNDMNIIQRKGKFIGFQKDWEQWLAEPSTLDSKLAESSTNKSKQNRQQKLAISSTELAESSTKVSSPRVTQKIKETITKDTIQKKGILKQKFGEFLNVFLTTEEHTKLINKFGERKTAELIERLSSAIASKGYRYQNHYATILNWERRDYGKDKPNPRQLTRNYTREEDL